MIITRVELVPFERDYPGEGYFMSHAHLTRLQHRLVRLVTDTGLLGYGEIARKSAAIADAAAAVEDARIGVLEGMALADLPGQLDRWRAEDDPSDISRPLLTLAAGVELAFLDLVARQAGLPLSAMLGGPATGDVGLYNSLSSGDPAEMAEKVRARPAYPVVQAKLGVHDIDSDLVRIRSVLEAMEPEQLMLADFNGGLYLETAKRALPTLSDPRLMWEDPCLTYDDNAELARMLEQPVMFDMCMGSVAVFLRAIREGVAGALVIKPAFMGGIVAARTARDMCTAAAIPMRIDGPWSGPLASVANLHLALGAPKDLLICSADLMDPFEGGNPMTRTPAPGRLAPLPGPGLGHIPDGLFPEAP